MAIFDTEIDPNKFQIDGEFLHNMGWWQVGRTGQYMQGFVATYPDECPGYIKIGFLHIYVQFNQDNTPKALQFEWHKNKTFKKEVLKRGLVKSGLTVERLKELYAEFENKYGVKISHNGFLTPKPL